MQILNTKIVELELVEIHEANPQTKLEVLRKKEWDFTKLYKDLGYLLINSIPAIPDSELYFSQKAIDTFICKYYAGTRIYNLYEKEDVVPETLEKDLSEHWKFEYEFQFGKWQTHWDKLTKFNEIKNSNTLVNDKPIPNFPSLSLEIFCGFHAINPYKTEWSRRYRNMLIRGTSKEIDEFLKRYKL